MIMQPRKKPFMVEFTGTPESGKTTVIHELVSLFADTNIKVDYVREAAETLPELLPKSSWDATLYMEIQAIASILLSSYSDNDIVLIDRGIVDGKFWAFYKYLDKLCSFTQASGFNAFQTAFDLQPDLLIALIASPEVTLKRRGGPGRMVNLDFLTRYNSVFADFYSLIEVPKVLINTTDLTPEETLESVKRNLDAHFLARN